MANSKVINGADLQLALQENNKKVKNYVDDNCRDIKKYQKYVNTELEYCQLIMVLSSNVALSAGSVIPYSKMTEGNMEFDSTKYSIKLKAGKTYELFADYRLSNSTAATSNNIYDITNGKALHNFIRASSNADSTLSDSSGKVIYTPITDCEVVVNVQWCSGTPLIATNNAAGCFIAKEIAQKITIDPLEHANSTDGVEDAPVGHIISYMGLTAPAHYLACDGTEYNISDYPYLSQHFIDQFGSVNYFGGDGTTTFAVPDLRGEFLRGTGTATRNTGSGADVGVHQDGTQQTLMANTNDDTNRLLFYKDSGLNSVSHIQNRDTLNTALGDVSAISFTPSNTGTSTLTGTRYTSRPTNTAVLYCIKYEPTYFMQNTYIGNEEVVLYEGNTKVECGANTTCDAGIQLVDNIDSYDGIRIYYGYYGSSFNLSAINCKDMDVSKAISGYTAWLPVIWGSLMVNVCVAFTGLNNLKVTQGILYNPENKATSVLGVNIYKIVGYRTSLKTQEE